MSLAKMFEPLCARAARSCHVMISSKLKKHGLLQGCAAAAARSLSYDINSRTKPHLNIGTIGHVDHGKVREQFSFELAELNRCLNLRSTKAALGF